MSLIADALKAAQRERSGGASETHRAAAQSVLRSSPAAAGAYAGMPVGLSPPLRWAAIALGAALMVAAALIYLAPDDASPPSTAAAEGSRQLPDPATTGRVDPAELPFLANLDPGVTGATPAIINQSGSDDTASGGFPVQSDDPSREGGAALPAGDTPSSGVSSRAAGASNGSPAPTTSAPSRESQPPAGAGDSTPATSPAPAPVPDQPTTVIHGRFELSVESSGIAVNDRMTEAVAAQRAGDTSGAIVLYEQILAQRPDHVEARNNLGIALYSRGDLAGARDAFRAVLAAEPGNASAWSNLGAVLNRLGQMDEAQAALGEASRLDPTNVGAKVNLANLLLARGLAADARQTLSEVLQRDPRHAEANYAMGKTLDAQGDYPGAVRYYQAFLSYGAGRFPSLDGPVQLRIQQLTAR